MRLVASASDKGLGFSQGGCAGAWGGAGPDYG